ncbi:MAG TPA: PD-(D/E)XK nuclease family protein [Candidatus Krumholzibacterium sp.]|nr:PD-(D/E)XK nuclease family protein [Candidatus Krumholzibacterium sp.]
MIKTIRNKFGWSISRESMFDACPRCYYFHYYLSWGGWNASSPALCREAFKLKRLTSLPLWRGQLVHYIATKVLASMRKNGVIPPAGKVLPYVEERFSRQLAFSLQRRYLTEPKKRGGRLDIDWLALFEHEYGRDLSPEKVESTLEECREGTRGLLESEILERILGTDPASWLIEDIDLAEFAQVFEFEGAQVFAKTDFIFRGDGGTFDIVDWKTFREKAGHGEGTEEGKARVQLGVYGFYASRVMREPLDSIRLHEVNLLDGGRVVEHTIDESNIDEFRGHISAGIGRLSSVLVDRDIERNEASGPGSCPKNAGPLCRYCNFYRICEDPESPLRLE